MRPVELPNVGLFNKRVAAFTLAEVTMCVAVTAIIFTGILTGYVHLSRNAERSESSEHSLAVLGLTTKSPNQAASRTTQDPPEALNEVLRPPSVAWANSDRPTSATD